MTGIVSTNEQDLGPFPVEQLLAIWTRLGRVLDALHDIGALDANAVPMRRLLEQHQAQGRATCDDRRIALALRVLSRQDNMHAADWLRMRAVEASMPRRKAPPATDLQLRLRGLSCSTFVAKCYERVAEDGSVEEQFRVTIRTKRGDVASAISKSFENAVDGACRMAGARIAEDLIRKDNER